MFAHRPAVKFVLPFIAGILIGWHYSLSLEVSIAGTIVVGILFFFFRKMPIAVFFSNAVLYFVIIFFGIFKISFDVYYHTDNNIARLCDEGEKEVSVKGIVVDRAIRKTKSAVFVIDVDSIFIQNRSYSVEGQVIVSIPLKKISDQTISKLEYGREVYLVGELRQPPKQRNPGEFDYRRYLLLNDIHAQLYIRDENEIIIGEVSGNFFLSKVVYPTREWVGNILDELVGGEEAKLLKGLVIGERSEMAPEVKEAFIRTGLMHILAISGFNVGLVTLMLLAVFSLTRFPKMITMVLTCGGLIFFVFLTGAQPPVVRAAIMAILILIARMLQEKIDLINIVAIAVLVQLLIDAKTLFDIGFQLSFAAVIALAYFYPKMMSLLKHLPELLSENVVIRYCVLSLFVSLAASIGTLPLTAYYFNRISIVGVALNLIAVPLSGILLSLGFTTVIFAAFSQWVGSVYAALASWLSSFLLQLTKWGGGLPFASVEVSLSFLAMAATYLLVYFLFHLHKKTVRKILLFSALGAVNCLVWVPIVGVSQQTLRVTFLDVGQGDAIFVEFPDGKNLLIDAGPRTFSFDAGRMTIVPFLQRKFVKRINALLITHPHNDHNGGVPSVLRRIQVDRIIEGGAYSNSAVSNEIRHLIDSLRLTTMNFTAGQIIDGFERVRLYILHPSEHFKRGVRTNLNNQSLVLRLVYGKTSILLTGDAEEEAEQQMVNVYGDFLRTQILKAGHHGSETSSTAQFISEVLPSDVVISVGRRNKYRHPSEIVMERYAQRDISIYRTDEEGAVVFESDGEQWRRVHWR